MRHTMNCAYAARWLVGCSLALGVFSLRPADARTPALGRRYIDPLRGFSFRPPAGTERQRPPSPVYLMTWQKRDPKTGAIAWVLGVRRAVGPDRDIDLKQNSQQMAKKLGGKGNFRISSVAVVEVAGKKAIDLRGAVGQGLGRYQRQVWVLAHPGKFLVFVLTGPAAEADDLNRTSDAVLATLEVTDPKAAWQRQQAAIERGSKLLADLADQELRAALADGRQWFLWSWQGKKVGFAVQTEAAVSRDGASGFEVRVAAMLQLPKQEHQGLKRVLFTTADRSVERWRERLRLGQKPRRTEIVDEGVKQQEWILSSITRDGKIRSQKARAPERIYLPRALVTLLPRLVDLSKTETHTFAVHSSEINRFDMHTFAVTGRETIDLDGRSISAVRATDQDRPDEEPNTLWLDDKGRVLRMTSPDGLTMSASTQDQVRRLYPVAAEAVAELEKGPRRPRPSTQRRSSRRTGGPS